MLEFALIEIRASDRLEQSRMLADVFHNLPAKIMQQWTADTATEAMVQIMSRAERYGATEADYVTRLRRAAEDAARKVL